MNLKTPPCRYVPRELWSMIDLLVREGLNQPGLWRDPSADHELAVVREAIDTGADLTGMK